MQWYAEANEIFAQYCYTDPEWFGLMVGLHAQLGGFEDEDMG